MGLGVRILFLKNLRWSLCLVFINMLLGCVFERKYDRIRNDLLVFDLYMYLLFDKFSFVGLE